MLWYINYQTGIVRSYEKSDKIIHFKLSFVYVAAPFRFASEITKFQSNKKTIINAIKTFDAAGLLDTWGPSLNEGGAFSYYLN